MDDNIEAEAVSVDTGMVEDTDSNEFVEESTQDETTTEETTEEVQEDDAGELYELPDGRKVSASQVLEEYKNLQTDYTRKSQKISEYEKNINNPISNNAEKEEWIPESYDEILEKAEERVLQRLEAKAQYEQEQEKARSEYVENQLAEVRKIDPKLNETILFQHAMKYGFQDLMVAHKNMVDMQKMVKSIQETTANNIQKRNADPISGGAQGGAVSDSNVYDPSIRTKSMSDFL